MYIALETPELSAQRVRDRVAKGGHDIPLEDIFRRHPKSLDNLKSYIKAFNVAHIYDNRVDRQWVAGYRNGLLHKKAQSIPSWLSRLLHI